MSTLGKQLIPRENKNTGIKYSFNIIPNVVIIAVIICGKLIKQETNIA